MKLERISHAVGGWTLVLMGIAHLVGHVLGKTLAHTPEEQAVLDAMRGFSLGAPGSATLLDIYDGFSLSFTLFSILAGVVALIVLRRAGDRTEILWPVRLALVLFLGIETTISFLWFIPPPTMFLVVATVAFLVSLLAMRRRSAAG